MYWKVGGTPSGRSERHGRTFGEYGNQIVKGGVGGRSPPIRARLLLTAVLTIRASQQGGRHGSRRALPLRKLAHASYLLSISVELTCFVRQQSDLMPAN